jgi:hypothetical protein
VYLATPDDNPFGSALAFYVVVEAGLIVKLPWDVEEDPDTGQVLAASDDLPRLPLSNLRLELSGGSHAWMTLPDACGTFATDVLAASWSGRLVGLETSFEVSQGAGGGPCPTPPIPHPHPPRLTPRPVVPPPPAPAETLRQVKSDTARHPGREDGEDASGAADLN